MHNVQLAIEHIFPLVYQYQMDKVETKSAQSKEGPMHMMPKSRLPPSARHRQTVHRQSDDDSEASSEDDEDDFDSEESQD